MSVSVHAYPNRPQRATQSTDWTGGLDTLFVTDAWYTDVDYKQNGNKYSDSWAETLTSTCDTSHLQVTDNTKH